MDGSFEEGMIKVESQVLPVAPAAAGQPGEGQLQEANAITNQSIYIKNSRIRPNASKLSHGSAYRQAGGVLRDEVGVSTVRKSQNITDTPLPERAEKGESP